MFARPFLFSLPTEDRRLLARVILPYFAGSAQFERVLFVGCAWYTRGYASLFRERRYWTLDPDASKRRWGAQRHIVASLARVRDQFDAASLDLVVCNGVFGWGLDDKAEVEAAFGGCYDCLRPGGVLVLGWNDVPRHRPFLPDECESLRRFTAYRFPPLACSCYRTGTRNRHTYNFYLR